MAQENLNPQEIPDKNSNESPSYQKQFEPSKLILEGYIGIANKEYKAKL